MKENIIFKDGTTGIFYNDSSVSEDMIKFDEEKGYYILHLNNTVLLKTTVQKYLLN